MKNVKVGLGICFLLLSAVVALAQNPLIRDQFTADPTARVFKGRIYVYPSHDVNCGTEWFCMKDYHVFSSENLVDWTDHGMIIDQDKVAWVDAKQNSMWAPDCYEKDGKYFFYFPAIAKADSGAKGMTVGAAISDNPYGPFVPEEKPIRGVSGIDPNVFIDKDGQAYLYWAGVGKGLLGARLKANMLELDGTPQTIEKLPEGMKEGPFLFERNGVYYFTFPHVIKDTEALVYATGNNPLGPFEYKGIIMDEHPSKCWTNHHSIVEYKGQWYLFYHHNDLSPAFDKNRSIRADRLFFNEDGTIQKVIPTLRGVGVVPATREIQIDRYSAIGEKGISIEFLDGKKPFDGWKTILKEKDAWIRFHDVDFGKKAVKSVKIKAMSESGGSIGLRVRKGKASREIKANIPKGIDWQVVKADFRNAPSGIQDIELFLRDSGRVEIDWIQFE
ncbi:MAG: family 43 glycosylhydrolase [Acidobacteria bacterium]|nr:family 43 glycosylhydrolase [Acidobacteriota bacterium]